LCFYFRSKSLIFRVQIYQTKVTSKAIALYQIYSEKESTKKKMSVLKNKMLAAAMSALMLTSFVPFSLVRAEEGMFMLDKVATLPLREKGLKISPNEIYNPNGGGLSEAVVRLDNGCTAEFVSPDGLILTNHHCGYDALVENSTPEKNYGEIGFKANNRAEEMPAGKKYSISIILKSEDVTAQVLNGINPDDANAVKARVEDLTKQIQSKAAPDVKIQIQNLNNGLYFYRFDTTTIKDIRVVYAPPKNIGFFGGDPDNFEWTRHCGDFTFLRAYVAPNGKPAEYSKDNVPYRPKKYLTLNTGGVNENDFTMIIGFPGGTSRYRESASVAFNQDVRLPFLIEYLQTQVDAIEAVGKTSPTKKVKLQADIFSLMNSIKAFEGGVTAMRRANIIAQKQADEVRLRQWVKQDASRQKYAVALDNLQAAYAEYTQNQPHDLIIQFMGNIPAIGYTLGALTGRVSKDEAKSAIAEVLGSEPTVNRETLKFFLRKAAELPTNQRIAAIEKRFGALQGEARLKAEDDFAARAFSSPLFTTEAGLTSLLDKKSDDDFVAFVREIAAELPAVIGRSQKFNAVVSKYRLPYMQAMFAMKGVANPYPDANFTQRFTYGAVKGYMPKEAVFYAPFTTLNGVFEKDTGREPFDAPAKLRDLWQRKDYGTYADRNGNIPVNLLTTNDIIGGNSGSPVMNANGEQIGIAFDGNYEGLGNDFFFNPALGRTIVVDIRYVLFLTEKFGDAGWILKEIKINK
jgi:hypothetical protein